MPAPRMVIFWGSEEDMLMCMLFYGKSEFNCMGMNEMLVL